ncbi:MAG TPA: hypothetical protein VHK67_07650 [Rhabdochlamydiaceae bacterium]|jgi:hypothetical protein|nr:hypothetical protein [Rhabdochlamydiaceae bacterium]
MKRIVSGFLCWICTLSAGGIPQEENLTISVMDNGIELWLKQGAVSNHAISCRVIAKNPMDAVPQIFVFDDCPMETFEEELPYFVDECKQKIKNEAQCKIAVIAVGDFEKTYLLDYLTSAFEGFSQRIIKPSARIMINPSSENEVYLSLSYPTAFQEIKTDQDLKKLWELYLLQAIVEERFRKTMKEGKRISTSQSKYMLPYACSEAKVKVMPGEEPKKMLASFLSAMNEIKSSGFSEQELSDAKAKLRKNLLNFDQKSPTNGILADYLASHCFFETGHPDYSIFMTMSFKMISEIERGDVARLIGVYFKDATRRVEMGVPASVTISESTIEEILKGNKTDEIVLTLKENNGGKNMARELYNQLPLTDDESKIIYQIIDALGNWDILKLFKKEDELTALGNKVQHVHPFKFLETVVNTPHLKESLRSTKGVLFNKKWRSFFDGTSQSKGFTDRCEREYVRDNLAPYIFGFCQTIKANPEQVRSYIERKDWEGLVDLLISLEN